MAEAEPMAARETRKEKAGIFILFATIEKYLVADRG
jgi:hypothetical protein